MGDGPLDMLWAPWRASYVMETKAEGCIFCIKPAQRNDAENYLLHRGAHCFVMLNAYPYNNGHLMVIPYAHLSDLAELPGPVAAELMTLTQHSIAIVRGALRVSGFNIGVNMGSAAGAGIADHVHLHVVPRWIGDSNFMTVVGETRVLPQSLDDTYRLLAPQFGPTFPITEYPEQPEGLAPAGEGGA